MHFARGVTGAARLGNAPDQLPCSAQFGDGQELVVVCGQRDCDFRNGSLGCEALAGEQVGLQFTRLAGGTST